MNKACRAEGRAQRENTKGQAGSERRVGDPGDTEPPGRSRPGNGAGRQPSMDAVTTGAGSWMP